MYLIGSRGSQYINGTYSHYVLVIDKCRNADYCADDKDIEEFVHDKILDVNYLDNKPNFDSFDAVIYQKQAYIGSFGLTAARFTDLGFTFTKNTY